MTGWLAGKAAVGGDTLFSEVLAKCSFGLAARIRDNCQPMLERDPAAIGGEADIAEFNRQRSSQVVAVPRGKRG